MAETPPPGHQEGKKSSGTKKRPYADAGSGSSVAMEEMPPHGHQEGKKSSATKKRSNADVGSSSSVAMAETPPRGPNHIQPPRPPLPPGVYFSPTPDECLGLLNRWIAGDNEMSHTRGFVFPADVYGESPDALGRRHPRASIREREHSWWFLSQTRFQSKTPGGGTSKRADRKVETAGYWKLDTCPVKLDDGVKNNLVFYADPSRKEDKRSKPRDKTAWLMQEFTSANDDGAGKRGVPALYRLSVSSRATDDQLRRLRGLFGEDGLKIGSDGTKKPARAVLPKDYYDGIAAKLAQGSARDGVVQEHVQPPTPPAAEAQERLLDYRDQQEHDLDQYYRRWSVPETGGAGASSGAGVLPDDFYSQQEQYLRQYQKPLSTVPPPLPPPASPSFLAEIARLLSTDNAQLVEVSSDSNDEG